MQNELHFTLRASHLTLALVTLVLLSTFSLQLSTAFAQGTAFTYQGRLSANGAPANGIYDFDFALFNTNSGGSEIGSTDFVLGVPVTNGLFTVSLDFGANFPGRDDKSISTLEFDGVELAAIQGLNQKIEEQKTELKEKSARISALEKEFSELKQAVKKLLDRKD